jgi:hypothetical protein
MAPIAEAIRECAKNVVTMFESAGMRDVLSRDIAESLVRELEVLVLAAQQDSGIEWDVLCVGVAIGILAQPLLGRFWVGFRKGEDEDDKVHGNIPSL